MKKEEIIKTIQDLLDTPEHSKKIDAVCDKGFKLIKLLETEQLALCSVSQQRELLVWLQKSDLVTFPKDEINEVIDDYRFYQTNCG